MVILSFMLILLTYLHYYLKSPDLFSKCSEIFHNQRSLEMVALFLDLGDVNFKTAVSHCETSWCAIANNVVR